MWIRWVVLFVFSSFAGHPAQQEITLYSGDGTPAAYVAIRGADNPVIYLWSGEPVAYLGSASGDGASIYGFNGKHLGWLVSGVARDRDGNAACGVRNAVTFAATDPIKSAKQLQPVVARRETEAVRPSFSVNWTATPCSEFLHDGAA